jgi:hypothetical protein
MSLRLFACDSGGMCQTVFWAHNEPHPQTLFDKGGRMEGGKLRDYNGVGKLVQKYTILWNNHNKTPLY